MGYEVSPEQYSNLVSVRNNWPDRLSFTWTGFFSDAGCVLNYLSKSSNQDPELERKSASWIRRKIWENLSEFYGIPYKTLRQLFSANNSPTNFFREHKRSKKVRSEFDKFFDEVEVVQNLESEVSDSDQSHSVGVDRTYVRLT